MFAALGNCSSSAFVQLCHIHQYPHIEDIDLTSGKVQVAVTALNGWSCKKKKDERGKQNNKCSGWKSLEMVHLMQPGLLK